MTERWLPCKWQGRVAQSRPRLIPSLLYAFPWLLHRSPHLPAPSSPSTTESRPTKPPTAGGHNLTFPRAQPGHSEPVWCGWADATHVYTARGEKRFEYLQIKTACKCSDEQTLKDQLHGLGPAARIVHFMSAAVTVPCPAIWLRHHPLCGVDSVHRHILLMGTCRQCGSWSVAGHDHRKVIGRDSHLCKFAGHGPWPVQKRFNRDRVRRGRSKTGCRIVELVLVWLTTEADDQSSLHCTFVLTDVMSDHIGHQGASHEGGCSKTSAYTAQFGWALMIWSILSVAALWCRGDAMLLSTGSHESCVGCRQPEIRHIELWSWVSIRFV